MKHLVGFLMARIEEDRDHAQRALRDRGDEVGGEAAEWVWARIGRRSTRFVKGAPSPDRVLVECEARQQLLGVALERLDLVTGGRTRVEDAVEIRLMASPYAQHPDYRPTWRP